MDDKLRIQRGHHTHRVTWYATVIDDICWYIKKMVNDASIYGKENIVFSWHISLKCFFFNVFWFKPATVSKFWNPSCWNELHGLYTPVQSHSIILRLIGAVIWYYGWNEWMSEIPMEQKLFCWGRGRDWRLHWKFNVSVWISCEIYCPICQSGNLC